MAVDSPTKLHPDDPNRRADGRWLAPPKGAHVITSKDASELARKRWDRFRDAFAQGMVDGTDGLATGPEEAWSLVGELTMRKLANDSITGGDLARLGAFAGKAGDFLPDMRGRELSSVDAADVDHIVMREVVLYLNATAPAGEAGAVEGEIVGN